MKPQEVDDMQTNQIDQQAQSNIAWQMAQALQEVRKDVLASGELSHRTYNLVCMALGRYETSKRLGDKRTPD